MFTKLSRDVLDALSDVQSCPEILPEWQYSVNFYQKRSVAGHVISNPTRHSRYVLCASNMTGRGFERTVVTFVACRSDGGACLVLHVW